MLLSDRDIRAELEAGRVVLDPYDPSMLQPSSIDVRLDRFFRLFDNHKYPFIDPATDQPDLTRLVEADDDEAFVLHPGEFVLGSTYEAVTLPDDVAARLEGKSSLGRLGLLTHSTAGFIDPGFSGHVTLELSQRRDAADQAVAGHEDRPAVLLPALVAVGAPVRIGPVRLPLPGSARPDGVPLLEELPPHRGLTAWAGHRRRGHSPSGRLRVPGADRAPTGRQKGPRWPLPSFRSCRARLRRRTRHGMC